MAADVLSDRTKGILSLVASAFGFAVMGTCVRWADTPDLATSIPISPLQKTFFRNAVAVVVAFALLCRHGGAAATARTLTRKGWAVLVLRSLLGTLGVFGNFYALSRIPLGDATTLNKLSPFFTVVFSWLFIRERISLRQALCVAGAFAGAMLIVKPGFAGMALLPALCGLFGGICAGAAYACVRELGLLGVDSRFVVFFFSLFSTLASVPFLVFGFDPMTWEQVAILVGAGLGAAAGQFGITAAYRFAPPREIAAWDYSNVVFAALFGYVLFDQVPDAFSWAGFALIVAMALLMRRPRRER